MANKTGPSLTRDQQLDAEASLESLSAVPIQEKSAASPHTPEATSSTQPDASDRETVEQDLPPKAALSSASFEFQRKPMAKKETGTTQGATRKSTTQKVALERGVRRSKNSDQIEQKGSQSEEAELEAPAPKTILDRFVSFIAAQLKKIEEFFLKMLGASPKSPESESELEEEEEEEELITLREQAARATYLANKAREERERKEEELLNNKVDRVANK